MYWMCRPEFAAEIVGEREQRGAFGDQDQQGGRYGSEAMHQRHGGDDDHDGEVDVNDRPEAVVVEEGLLQRHRSAS